MGVSDTWQLGTLARTNSTQLSPVLWLFLTEEPTYILPSHSCLSALSIPRFLEQINPHFVKTLLEQLVFHTRTFYLIYLLFYKDTFKKIVVDVHHHTSHLLITRLPFITLLPFTYINYIHSMIPFQGHFLKWHNDNLTNLLIKFVMLLGKKFLTVSYLSVHVCRSTLDNYTQSVRKILACTI